MGQRFYATSEFARLASVSARTLRYYDREGLLSPAQHSEAGYRRYSDDDLRKLQQILALKFLGFRLAEIRAFMRAEPEGLAEALARQKAMMQEKQAQVEAVIKALERAQDMLQRNHDLEALVKVMEVMQVEKKNDWAEKYFTPEQRKKMQELSDASYSPAAKETMASWGEWTEEDQKRVDTQYAHLASKLKRLVAEGKDPAGPEAQALAKLQVDLLSQFTRNDPEVEAGLNTWWQNFSELPAEEKPPALPWGEQESAFLAEAMAIYKRDHP